MDVNEDFERPFEIGDLVAFISYNYTPDFYYGEDYENAMGIVVDIDYYGDSMSQPWMYHVFWFDTQRVTAVVGGHIRIISRPST